MKKIINYIKGIFLFPYYAYINYKSLKKLLSKESEGFQREELVNKILAMGGTVNSKYVELSGLKIKNCFENLPLIVVENLYFQKYNFFDPDNSYICLDIGANVGISSLYLASKSNVRKVYAFEPLGPTFEFFKENLSLNAGLRDKINPYNFGLGDRKQHMQVKFNLDQAMSVSSKSTFDGCFSEYTLENIMIEDARTALVPIIESHFGKERIFLKVDCEGAEYDIIPHLAGCGVLSKIDVVVIEFHNDKPDALLHILRENAFFCFCEWERHGDWEIGFIKGVRIQDN
ncbi:FkbM family methyltransferase [Ereboglobus luteus]|uniref:Methyltransferase FkbM domain-containing protein n=1 Tax=Ereboglobus luteus TaxID=1796921 RepID=A0A2U8E5Q1_9BACT|nr:FkbM family methyltransferase [Ereboglobus luteus]AWI10177.1 hypothetical protein CKA38_13730 [Ereboglobus luteus]